MPITARVTCRSKAVSTDPDNGGWAELSFELDKADPHDNGWLFADNPRLAMTVVTTDDAAEQFHVAAAYTLTIAEEG